MLLAVQRLEPEVVALIQRRQDLVLVVGDGIVQSFLINRDKARRDENRSRRPQHDLTVAGTLGHDVQSDRVVDRRDHLACHRALPDQLVKPELIPVEILLDLIDPDLVPRLPLLGAVLHLPIPDNDLTRSFDVNNGNPGELVTQWGVITDSTNHGNWMRLPA